MVHRQSVPVTYCKIGRMLIAPGAAEQERVTICIVRVEIVFKMIPKIEWELLLDRLSVKVNIDYKEWITNSCKSVEIEVVDTVVGGSGVLQLMAFS